MSGNFIAAVDADIIAYRVAAACEEETQFVMEDTIRGFIYEMWKETKAENYCFLLTGSGNYRYDIAVTKPYKGNRKDVTKPKWLQRAREYLVEEYKAIMVDGYEADDACISLADRYAEDNPMIISVDKDLKQCPCTFYDPVKQTIQQIGKQEASIFLWQQVMKGDPTDNIQGLPKVGDAKAKKFIEDAWYSDVALPLAVLNEYKERGFNYEYFQEQLDLVRMRKDVFLPYEEHFIQLGEHSKPEPEFNF